MSYIYDYRYYTHIHVYIYPPTSPERRACETTAIKIHHAFQNPSPSSKASAQAAQDDPCLQQPRLDGAKSDQLFFIGATARPNPAQTGATGRPTLSPLLKYPPP